MKQGKWGRLGAAIERAGLRSMARGGRIWALVGAVGVVVASCDDGSTGSRQVDEARDGGLDGSAGNAGTSFAHGGASGNNGGGPDSGMAATHGGGARNDASVDGGGGMAPTLPQCADALDRTHATVFYDAAKCLFEGADAPQRNVKARVIDPRRVAIVRGIVSDDSGAPLAGVNVSVLNHDEFGQTATRADGYFDMAVNGGAPVTVVYEKAGYLSAERHMTPGWREFAVFPDVVLKAMAEKAAAVDLGASASAPVVIEGDVSKDASGERHELLVVAPGTTAKMVMPDGSKQTLKSFHVHVTEYTVGDNGPAAMPADLPPTSGYTYAVDYSVDEATAAGASSVAFNPPVVSYVDNFLGFPVGTAVPRGGFDPTTDTWQPMDSGVVLKVLATDGGSAQVDTDGDDEADDDTTLTKLGITSDELAVLAGKYSKGTTLWRVLVPHFSAWDSNWGFGPPHDGTPPPGGASPGSPTQCQNTENGSIIGCEGQTLGEVIPIAQTPFSLRYQSERVAGRTDAYQVNVVLSGTTLPESVKQIVLEAEVLGQKISRTYDPKPDLTDAVAWDGLDAYGRAWQGRQTMQIRIGYVYDGVYEQTSRFGSHGNGVSITGDRTRKTVTLWSSYETMVGAIDAQPLGLAGWMLDAQHFYDIPSGTLYMGDGSIRSADALGPIINTVAGGHGFRSTGDGGKATDASLLNATGLAVAPDGTFYLCDTATAQSQKIRKVAPDGTISTIAGGDAAGFDGDGGPATAAHLANPAGLALLADGTLLVADSDNDRVRAISPKGIISTFAGNGNAASDGDGGPATQASVNGPVDIAVASDGSIYIAEPKRVRRVMPDGTIMTAAGNGKLTVLGDGDGGAAVGAAFAQISSISVDGSGQLFIADQSGGRVRVVGTDGVVRPFFGGGSFAVANEPLATDAQSNAPRAVFANPDGRVFIAQSCPSLAIGSEIIEVTPDGHVHHFAGCGPDKAPYGENGPAAAAEFQAALGLRAAPDGSLYFAASGSVYAIHPTLERFSTADVIIASTDGRSVFVFDAQGRHLRTLDARTGSATYTFDYDSGGVLSTVTDAYGNVTTFKRDAAEALTAIVGPYGAKTNVSVGGDGFLSKLENPNGEATTFTYATGGLLATLVSPRSSSYVHTFEYDSLGRLTKDTEPSGVAKSLSRKDSADSSYHVTLATSLGRKTLHDVSDADPAHLTRTITSPDGVQQTVSRTPSDATYSTPSATTSSQVAGDPRFGLQAPVTSWKRTEAGGPAMTVVKTRSATLSDPTDLLSATMLIDENKVNDQTWTTTWDGTSKNETVTTPEGRSITSTFSAQGDVTSVQTPGIDAVGFTYDDHGRITAITQGNQSTAFTYDAAGNVASATDPLGAMETYDHDKVGRLLARHRADGSTVAFAYDAEGNVISVTPPGKAAHLFTYDADNRIASYTAPDVGSGPTVTNYAYDKDGNATTITTPDGTITLSYDSAGRVSSVALPSGTANIGYDAPTGHLASIDGPYDTAISYSYTGDRLATTTWTGTVAGSVSRTYDDFFRVATETINGNAASKATFAYDNDGLVTDVATGTADLSLTYDADAPRLTATKLASLMDALGYDSRGHLATYSAKYGGTILDDVAYTRDALDRIQLRTETIQAAKTATEYGYDQIGRLISVAENGKTVRTYDYDDNGNRTKFTDAEHSTSSAATYDAQDRMLTYGNLSYAYTKDGALSTTTDMTTGALTKFVYDLLGNLTHVDLADGRTIDYVVDGLGRRVGKKLNGKLQKQWIYGNALRILAELDGAGNLVSRFVYTTRPNVPEYVVKSGTTYRLVLDQLGSPRLVVNVATGAVAERIDRDEFGVVKADSSTGFVPFGFAGGLYDADTGFVRFGKRDYDPSTGRWTTTDATGFDGSESNLFVYAADDPVNNVDWDGNSDVPTTLDNLGKLIGEVASEIADLLAGGASAAVDACLFAIPILIPSDSSDSNWYNKEHTKNARPSTEQKHQDGQTRKQRDQGGEKADPGRRPPRKRPPGKKGPWPPPKDAE